MEFKEKVMEEEFKSKQSNEQTQFRLFLDDKIQSFFRRPDWSPDGSFCLLPAAQYQESRDEKPEAVVLLYIRVNMQQPTLALKTNNRPAICTRFCPKIFELDPNNSFSLFDLPYKMIFAIATIDMVLIYSTQSLIPLCIVGQSHYQIITDISWLEDKCISVSSSDGYCSFILFNDGELGTVINKDKNRFVNEPELWDILNVPNYYRSEEYILKRNQSNKDNQIQQELQQQQQKIEYKVEQGVKKKFVMPFMIKQL